MKKELKQQLQEQQRKTIKKYEAGSELAISVALKSGGHRFARFDTTSRGSVLWTDDEEVQWGIEHHWMFGGSIVLSEMREAEKEEDNTADPESTGQDSSDHAEQEYADEEIEEQESEELKNEDSEDEAPVNDKEPMKVTVSGAEDAVDYLVENHGYKAGKLRSMKAIRAAAMECGIEFEGMD